MNKLEELIEAIGELDYMYQEGIIFTPEEVEVLRSLSNQLQGIVTDLENSEIQKYLNQVR